MAATYSTSVSYTGSAKRALAIAQNALIAANFQIVSKTDFDLHAVGRGITSTRQDPLKAATDITMLIRNSSIEVNAILGGADRMKKFLRILPLSMAALFLVVFGTIAVFVPDFRRWWIFLIPVAVLSPWLVLGPVIARSIRAQAEDAINSLLGNMVTLGSLD